MKDCSARTVTMSEVEEIERLHVHVDSRSLRDASLRDPVTADRAATRAMSLRRNVERHAVTTAKRTPMHRASNGKRSANSTVA